MKRRTQQQGVALVVTLLMLAVITFMAITFLVVSRSEKGSVTTTTDQTTARFAADTGLERAKVELLAPILAWTNEQIYRMMVSTNYINPAGFQTGIADPTNVNYSYPNGNPVSGNDLAQNLANLLFNPSAPVFVTNRLNGSNEFRSYLDLNRNNRHDPSGFRPVIGLNGGYLHFQTNNNGVVSIVEDNNPDNAITNYFIGDPEWIGVLERPDQPHSSSNRFLSRYAYVIVPSGHTLDLNYIHNYAKRLSPTMQPAAGDGFLRNQGVGSWEINLAAFLVDLNTNYWQPITAPYLYETTGVMPSAMNRGVAFDDALSLLRYRYVSRYDNTMIPNMNVSLPFQTIGGNRTIDYYSDGPLMRGLLLDSTLANDTPTASWAGADNPNHYFTTQDVFDWNKTAMTPPLRPPFTFTDRLYQAGTNDNSYDRYTFYRFWEQIGTDSAPEDPNRININFDNLVQRNARGVASATNFYAWQPVAFFTNAANRMLARAGYNFTTANIQIAPTNYYTPAVHRILQLAANVYDATTNAVPTQPHIPSVFRPIFGRDGDRLFIAGYQEVTNTVQITDLNGQQWMDASATNSWQTNFAPANMVYGVPLVIGAKKGLPNFNEFAMETAVTAGRKFVFTRPDASSPPNRTNQIFTVGISNVVAVEAWNSYMTNFNRPVQMRVEGEVIMRLTNEFGVVLRGPNNEMLDHNVSISRPFTNYATWPAASFDLTPPQVTPSFRTPVFTNYLFLTNSVYRRDQARFLFNGMDPNNIFPVPRLWLTTQVRLRYMLIDTGANRILDYVNLDSTEDPLDITHTLAEGGSCNGVFDGNIASLFCTNRLGNANSAPQADNVSALTYGMKYQLDISMGNLNVLDDIWRRYSIETDDMVISQNRFRRRLLNQAGADAALEFSTPFNPDRTVRRYVSWQANDPLVHYTIEDLRDQMGEKPAIEFDTESFSPIRSFTQNRLNDNFRPWGGNPNKEGADTEPPTNFELGVKDPGMRRPDFWEFPTNKFPNVGWLGRVHRGTPWQTVYLKSESPGGSAAWTNWSGHIRRNWDRHDTTLIDAIVSHPTNDWKLLDVFTTAVNDNAARGRLSVNQTNLAAWSAVLSGVIALDGDPAARPFRRPVNFNPVVIEPVGAEGTNSPLWHIVAAINDVRRTNTVSGVFNSVGDVLATPELTVSSPYLNVAGEARTWGVPDAVYERIPQQIMSLLTHNSTPRFVVYSWGQTLRPAERSVLTSGPHFGMVTNYQVTGEVATRAVVRIEDADKRPSRPRVIIESYNILPPD